ncbi:MAG: PVC-type heme-binding CxxCH protein [Chitinophagaceae bacterium]
MLHKYLTICAITMAALLFTAGSHKSFQLPGRLEVLLLGHESKHHDSEKLTDILSRELFKDGINISYTTDPDDLNENNLQKYDGLILYANIDKISPSQEKALLNYVKGGKGFIPLHSASFCFRNSPEVVEMIGGQFKSHKWDSFPAVIVKPEHPVVKGIPAFITTDETYVHEKISKNIEVISERVEGSHREPYTWVRNYGKGRVFYTAYGHDEHTFNNKDFINLVRNGILWAVGDQARSNLASLKLPEPKYTDAKIPNYERRNPPPQLQEPLTPAQSMQLTQVPVGFELQLFAAEPDIINPIHMNWDERGRLWVIETVDYPNTVRDNKETGDDRIKILEDTNGDGKADKITIFADKLNIPTSFVFANDGIVVSQAPYFLYFKDTNGDDKADVKDTVITGWGTYDTHAGPSSLRYGLDNKLWGVVGYSGFRGKIGKDSLRFSSGLYRFTADGKDLEYLSTTSNNTWGLGFSEEFDVFISTANNTHSGFFSIPFKYLTMADITESGVEKIDAHYGMHVVTKNLRQVDVFGGFTAAAGHSLYTARQFPKEYWNRVAFVNEPTGRLIHRHILEQTGAGFKEKGDGWNMLASADDWAGPVQAEVGPDGALWVLDWYDFIIQHNPTPSGFENGKGNAYINPLRDHDRGRIYRIKYKNSEDGKPLNLNKKDANSLVQALSNNNMFWRTTAQRLLVESGNTSVLPELYKLVRNDKPDEAGINASAIHALWTMHGLKALDGSNKEALDVAIKALSHPSGGVRRAAVQVLPVSVAATQALVKANVFKDKDLRVRLAAVLAASDAPASNELGSALFDMAEKEENINDPWIKNALYVGTKVHRNGFLASFKKKGLSENPSLGEATTIQRFAMASRLKTISLRSRQMTPADRAHDVTGKEILISANIEKGQEKAYSGMILAHGDKANGYGLYMMNDKLYFQVNQDGTPFVVNTSSPLPAKFQVNASLQQNGSLTLVVDNKQVAATKAKGLFTQPLKTALRLGFDMLKGDDKLGNYPDTFRVANNMVANPRIDLLDPGTVKKPDASKAIAAKADQVITITVVKNVMKFDKELIQVKAGTTVQIVLQNPDFMQHNLVVIKPKTTEKVGAAADKLAQDPDGAKMNYVPRMPEVLFATPLINPEGKFTLKFKVPDTAGDYPYVCTFPGHWRIMKGIMKVTK